MKTIDSFRGEYRFLSNFWMVDIVNPEDGLTDTHAYRIIYILNNGPRNIT